jgi:hypothetical protein
MLEFGAINLNHRARIPEERFGRRLDNPGFP